MAREFAKAFYRSQAWQRAREAYLSERKAVDGGLCELCGDNPGVEVHHKIFLRQENIDDTEITLNPDNFMLLCGDCHHLEHEAARRAALQAAKRRDSKKDVLQGGKYWFDEDGGIHPFQAHLVWGCPGSGKTTYVRNHMRMGDLVIDLDLIGRALGMAEKTDIPGNIQRISYDVRDYLYQQIADRRINAREVWVIAGLPRKDQRKEVIKKLKITDTVFIDASFRECYQHVLHDPDRKDKAVQLSIIEKWFKDFEREPETAPIKSDTQGHG